MDCRDDPNWHCGTCGNVVEREWRVFGSCYRCAAQRSIAKRDAKIASLKARLGDSSQDPKPEPLFRNWRYRP